MNSELVRPLPLIAESVALRRVQRNARVVLGLAVATLLLHGSVLFSGWKFDDGALLLFAARYSPWQYFGVPEVLREQSYAHITPWSVLFLDLGLPFFGPRAAGHYAHLLGVLWLVAVATWALLRRWLGPAMALGGALLFLAMPSTGAIAHMLMTGHYAYGLLFSVLALLAFAGAAESGSVKRALLAALLYGLACLCKELYVPLVAVFLVWPGLALRTRASLCAPMLCVALLYAAFRLHVLGGVGGYAALAGGTETLQWSLSNLLAGIRNMQVAMFGPGWAGGLALLITGSAIAVACWRGRRPSLLLLVVSAAVLLAPLVPLFFFAFPGGLDRVMFLLAWAAAVFVAWQFEKLRWRGLGVTFLLLVLALGQWTKGQALESQQHAVIARNDFMVHANSNDTFVSLDFGHVGIVRSMRDAAHLITGKPGPVVVGTEEDFIGLGSQAGRASWAWQADCACIQRMGARYDQQVADLHRHWASGQALPMELHVEMEDRGRAKTIRWRIGGAEGQAYVEVRDEVRLDLPRQGTLAFGRDMTFWPPDPAQLRFVVTTAQGSTVHSPWLSLPLSRSSVIDWSGLGSSPPALK